ncbi:DUF3742 family protein [Pseudomonas aeruginosa]|uniref:DUF3742 family protein n=2 Tax=Pseudomonas aeruginosa TaxID=287 RepID=UPI001E519ED7|nr:DUF3742 family protein [Pseudomonas aeruginosa]MCS8258904.1 DUF3742 family protein [Pseudomonas aeruginosa]
MMNAHANKGFAARVGHALGTLVRFCLHDHRPVVRWAKRVSLLIVLLVVLVLNFTWLASASMSLLCMGLVGWALVRSDMKLVSVENKISLFDRENGYRDGLSGYGHYINGMRVDD